MPSTPGPRVTRTAGACSVAAAAVLAGCAVNPFAVPSDSVYRLDVGTCLDGDAGSGGIADFTPTACDRPHHGEIYARIAIPDGDQLSEDELGATADTECGYEFEHYVGTGLPQSEFEMATALDGREATCIAVDPTGATTGSVAGTRR
ncbi:hypothetical protein [Streptomonospora salina]|uniref:Septum formation-related domain-containing protein n=1 Tax=Streptomonospora salina TaxID=104205 RepID=A0A841EDP8_9ACTN|nr:hypothetical protein [Streptomonospora salina]MBB6001255.1 hypothetical protein [Streptomonospora salina]